MKFSHMVKHNGVYYPAGTDVPINGEGVTAPAVNHVGTYTEEDLNLPYGQLKKLAKQAGLKVSNTQKASELKAMLRSV